MSHDWQGPPEGITARMLAKESFDAIDEEIADFSDVDPNPFQEGPPIAFEWCCVNCGATTVRFSMWPPHPELRVTSFNYERLSCAEVVVDQVHDL